MKEGDKFEVRIENNLIILESVAIYSKEYIFKLAEEVQMLREDLNSNIDYLENVGDLIKSLKR